ncbi:MAG: signal peptide peptidase SppA [Deltaproteobacteria bacterium]|nr:signal peptide peptidase SppA [Deltaproteobacteria bacterium]
MKRFAPVLILALGVALGGSPGAASAQLRGRTDHVLTPGVPVSAPDDANAVDVNPAAMGFLDGASLTYSHAEADDGVPFRRGGDAFRLALPLIWGLAIGGSAQSIRPTGATGELDRGMGNLALAYAAGNVGVGTSIRWFGTAEPLLSGATGWDLAASWRPVTALSLSFIARDINGPLGLGANGLPASFALALGLRPLGTRDLLFDFTGVVDTEGRVGVRGLVSIDAPWFGRIYGSAEVDRLEQNDPRVMALAGLSVDWSHIGAGGGAFGGEDFGDTAGWFVTGRVEGFRRRGIPTPRYVADIEVSGVGARGIVSVVRLLDRAMHDDDVAGVLLRFRDSGIGSAYAQEIRLMVEALQRAGKPVLCHLEAANGGELYACVGADQTFVDPAGGAWLTGTGGAAYYFGEIAENLGVGIDVVRIGPYKSAPELYANRGPSEQASAQRRDLYGDVFDRMVSDFSEDLDVDQDAARALIDDGPYVAPELTALGLADGRLGAEDLDSALAERMGGRYRRRAAPPAYTARRWGGGARVGVVMIDGDIVTGENVDIPLLGIRMSGAETIISTLDGLVADPRTEVIILRIDSPGGSVLAADQIFRAVMRARRHKPVIASMGAVAASAAYEIAAGADEIWADPATLTGSIGVFFIKVDLVGLAQNIGVNLTTFGRGRHHGLDSLYRPFTPEERSIAADKVRIWYRMFLNRVHQGRGMPIADIDAIARGRVYSGDRAHSLGLVDRLGGFGGALARARQLGGLAADVPIVVVPQRPVTLVDYLFGVGAFSRDGEGGDATAADAPAPLSPEVAELAGLATLLARSADGLPVARLEQAVVGTP